MGRRVFIRLQRSESQSKLSELLEACFRQFINAHWPAHSSRAFHTLCLYLKELLSRSSPMVPPLSTVKQAFLMELRSGSPQVSSLMGIPACVDILISSRSQGILYKGCSNTAATISNCYNLTLTSNPNEQLDPNFLSSPRQRIELRGDSHPSGSSYSFQWKQFLASSVGTSTHFFHSTLR